MNRGINVATIAGIPVHVHWTVLAVGWLMTWSLATALLPAYAEGAAPAAYWLAGLAGAAALFASLLAHEVGHALVARREGVRVDSITLWLFGGVAHLHDDAPTPGAEARIAGVGPAVSLALAVAAALAAGGALAAGVHALVVAVLAWLAVVNAALTVFNLLPGAPLDGGRLLRAWLWRSSGDRASAVIRAGRAGRVVGNLVIAAGLVEIVLTSSLGGLWTVMIGLFLRMSAQAEMTAGAAERDLQGVTVEAVMTRDPITAPAWVNISTFLERYVGEYPFAAFPVREFDGGVIGIVLRDDALRVPAAQRGTTRLATIARPLHAAATAQPNEPAAVTVARMAPPVRRVLVFDGPHLVGIVAPADLTRAVVRVDATTEPEAPRELVDTSQT